MKREHAELFEVSPKTTVCARCRGTGHVRERSQELEPDLTRQSTDQILYARPLVSSYIFDATRHASDIARRSGLEVRFEFMDRTVSVGPTSDPDLVARDWWISEYGKTPEESRAER